MAQREKNLHTMQETQVLFFFLTLQYCIGFTIYQHESATGIHVFPILNPPPSSLPIPSLWVFDARVWNIPWRREWQLTPVSLSREFQGQRSLAGYNSWGCKESDMT